MSLTKRDVRETNWLVKILAIFIVAISIIYGALTNFFAGFNEWLNITGIAICGLFIASFYLSKGWASRFVSLIGAVVCLMFFSPIIILWLGDFSQYSLYIIFIIFMIFAIYSRTATPRIFIYNFLATLGLLFSTLGVVGTLFISSLIEQMYKINSGLFALAFALGGILLYLTNRSAENFTQMP